MVECQAIHRPRSCGLIYASDFGVSESKVEAYSIGAFVEIKCNEGYHIGDENLISCTMQGTWDFVEKEYICQCTNAKN